MSSWLLGRLSCTAVGLGLSAHLLASSQVAPPLPESLRSAGAWLREYERQAPAIVAEERYEQVARKSVPPTAVSRRLRSDVLVITDEAAGWVGFRDVFEVDGRPVRDRDERLANLILKPHAEILRQAKRIAEESARFNVNVEGIDVRRTVNMPMTALRFIRLQNQHRSTFKTEGVTTVNGVRAVVVRFDERAQPRIIATSDRAAAHGRVWIEPGSGQIVRSELGFETKGLATTITVTFAPEPKVGLWVPISMDEEYRIGIGDALLVQGHATYSNFRKFTVDTREIVKAP